MSFTLTRVVRDSSFELVRQSLLQDEGLPFADALTVEQIQQAFHAEGISFAEGDSEAEEAAGEASGIVYTTGITLWAMLSQALYTGPLRACRAAVQRVAVYCALQGLQVSSTNTGAYCRARAKVTEKVVQRLAEGVAERCEAAAPAKFKWKGFDASVIDGTTFSMPDTPLNQEAYPQLRSQTQGVGFPIMRAVALTSLTTGMVQGLATGPYSGKETGETALFRTLFNKLGPGHLVLADRYFGGWFMLALLHVRGVEFATRLHQLRQVDFRQGRRLGPGDHVGTWPKPQKPAWLDQETYDLLPQQLEVRETQVNVDVPGFRTQELVVVSSLFDQRTYTRQDLADLYRRRWGIELELRDIKSLMQLDVLRRKTPAAVRQELWTGILAYNLVRQSMLQSALAKNCKPHELSFAASLQMLSNTWLLGGVAAHVTSDAPQRIAALRVLNGHSHRVGDRPNRVEPRAVKRRPDPIALLTEPREVAREKLLAESKT